MRLYLVHHGDAVPTEIDVQRPLSARGVADVKSLAAEAARRGVRPVAVWHSGKLRARQTAESFWRACNPLAEFSAVRGLQPTDPALWMQNRLAGEAHDVMCVGHLPNIARLLRILLTGHEEGDLSLPLHGLVALERGDDGVWTESWRLDPSAR